MSNALKRPNSELAGRFEEHDGVCVSVETDEAVVAETQELRGRREIEWAIRLIGILVSVLIVIETIDVPRWHNMPPRNASPRAGFQPEMEVRQGTAKVPDFVAVAAKRQDEFRVPICLDVREPLASGDRVSHGIGSLE
jgi:hypothetical protein